MNADASADAGSPASYKRALRDYGVKLWLEEAAGKIRWWTGKAWKQVYLTDAYRRGYDNGYKDGEEDAASSSSL